MNTEKIIEYYHKGITERGCCLGPVMFACMILAFLLVGCKTITKEESLIDKHHIYSMMERIDSLVTKSYVTQQDSSWRELVMRQFESIKEKSDTNHIRVVDTAGNVIKETIVINNTKEIVSEKDRLEREIMIHKLEVMDSVISVQSEYISKMDSLLQESVKEKTIEKKLSWWQSLCQKGKGILIGILLSVIVFLVMWLKKKIKVFI